MLLALSNSMAILEHGFMYCNVLHNHLQKTIPMWETLFNPTCLSDEWKDQNDLALAVIT